MPHVPLYASDKHAGKTPTVYGDIISEIDSSLGQILDALKRTGIEEKTLVVFTSDNGPLLLYGNHGGWWARGAKARGRSSKAASACHASCSGRG